MNLESLALNTLTTLNKIGSQAYAQPVFNEEELREEAELNAKEAGRVSFANPNGLEFLDTSTGEVVTISYREWEGA